MAKNRALTLKKAHLRREKIQSALLDKADFLYIKDIADLCAMQTVDISNDLKEMTRLGLLSKKEDKTAHPKRLMYKLKPVAAARLVKESKVSAKKEAAKPTSLQQDSGTVAEKAGASAAPASKTKSSKVTVAKNSKLALSKEPVVQQSSEAVPAKSAAKSAKAAAAKPSVKPAKAAAAKPAVKSTKAASKPEENKSVDKASAKASAKVSGKAASKVTAPAPVAEVKATRASKAEKTPKAAKSAPVSKGGKAAPSAKIEAPAPTKKAAYVSKKAAQASAPAVPAPRKRAPSGATQGQILAELAKGEALSIDALCQRLDKQTANMYKMVGSLHAQGQIQKHKSGGRGYVYSLTGSAAPVPVVSAKPASKGKAATASEAELLDHLIDKLAGAAKGFLRSLIRN
ncbi:MAG: hypothetical protein IV090_13140 [Candidatus Sericytochromatia bacterium]|nr:hypothetical protein [Candidatus Sericytochromatia bacterium]